MSTTEVRSFDIKTCAEDFAGQGREITVHNEATKSGTHRAMEIKVNGWTLSCTWGKGAYCTGARGTDHPPEDSPNAEVAASRDGGKLIEIDGNHMAGWVKPTRVFDALAAAERDDEDGIRKALIHA